MSSSSDDESNKESSKSFSQLPDMETIRRLLANSLNLRDEGEKQDKIKILDEPSIDCIAQLVKEKKIKNIITLAGAGISTAAGIPDFRSPGTGLYHNMSKYKLSRPEAIFDINYFRKDPRPFYSLAKELYPDGDRVKPTLSHYFIKLLEDEGLLLRHYTQNIDGLERVAGVTKDKIMEAHGTFNSSHCLKCKKEYDRCWLEDAILNNDDGDDVNVPQCEECKNVVKPDIIFYGEVLPDRFYNLVSQDLSHCQLLIVMGSSLKVQPVASLVSRVPTTCPRLLLNNVKVGRRQGLKFDSDDEGDHRDVCWIDECDNGCKLLAEKLGWKDKLMRLYADGHKELDAKHKKSKEMKKSKSNSKRDQAEGIDDGEKVDKK